MPREDNMGRYPFRTWTFKYLDAVGPTYAKSTLIELGRRYKRLDRIFRELHREGKVTTHDPVKMKADDILAIVGRLKSDGLKEQSVSHDLTAINNLLSFAGNNAVMTFKAKYRSLVPKNRHIRAPEMDEEAYDRLFEIGDTIPNDDWVRLRAFAMVELALCAGLRAKEIQFASVHNLDMKKWTLYLDRVKGEGTYGEARTVPIRREGRALIKRYIQARERFLVENRATWNPYIFPTLSGKPEGYLSTNTLRLIKSIVEEEIEYKFDLRMCRRTYGQRAVDEGIGTENVSLLLGHHSTKTTEDYYCRQRPTQAIKTALAAWDRE
jgi:integrase/recombinase XerD